jgi:hypothetical protein
MTPDQGPIYCEEMENQIQKRKQQMQAEHAQQEREERKRRQDERRRWREELEKEDQQETAELGMRAEGKWIEIRKIAAKEAYEELVRRRFKLKQEEDKINQAMTR